MLTLISLSATATPSSDPLNGIASYCATICYSSYCATICCDPYTEETCYDDDEDGKVNQYCTVVRSQAT